MVNGYYIAHNAPQFLGYRGFGWDTGAKGKKKKKGKGKKKKWGCSGLRVHAGEIRTGQENSNFNFLHQWASTSHRHWAVTQSCMCLSWTAEVWINMTLRVCVEKDTDGTLLLCECTETERLLWADLIFVYNPRSFIDTVEQQVIVLEHFEIELWICCYKSSPNLAVCKAFCRSAGRGGGGLMGFSGGGGGINYKWKVLIKSK